jgi:transposase
VVLHFSRFVVKNKYTAIAYQLHKDGKSYKEIATILNTGKTTAYDHVKEIKSGGLNYVEKMVKLTT